GSEKEFKDQVGRGILVERTRRNQLLKRWNDLIVDDLSVQVRRIIDKIPGPLERFDLERVGGDTVTVEIVNAMQYDRWCACGLSPEAMEMHAPLRNVELAVEARCASAASREGSPKAGKVPL